MIPEHKAAFAVASLCYQTFTDMAPAFAAAALDEETSCDGVLRDCIEQEINQLCGKCLNQDRTAALDDAVRRLDAKSGNLGNCPETLRVYKDYVSAVSGHRHGAARLYEKACARLEELKAVAHSLANEFYHLAEDAGRRSENLIIQSGGRFDPLCSTDPEDLTIVFRFKPYDPRGLHTFDFYTYQNISFAFLHECVSHVVPRSIRYRQFSEGWLLWAAQQFLFLKGAIPDISSYHLSAVDLFVQRCLHGGGTSLAPIKGYRTASEFWDFVVRAGLDPAIFHSITSEAAMRPHNHAAQLDFHHSLMRPLVDFMAAAPGRQQLRAILDGYTTFDDFYSMLTVRG